MGVTRKFVTSGTFNLGMEKRSKGEIKYREKYEAMLRGTMKEIEGTVRKAQRSKKRTGKTARLWVGISDIIISCQPI